MSNINVIDHVLSLNVAWAKAIQGNIFMNIVLALFFASKVAGY